MLYLKWDKATICTLGAFGGSVREVRLLEVQVKKMAQYPSAIHYTYIEKGKRRRTGFVQGHAPNLVVFAGWGHAIRFPDALVGTRPNSRVSRFSSFAKEYGVEFSEAIDAFIARGHAPAADYRAFPTHQHQVNEHGLTYQAWLEAAGLTMEDEDDGLWEKWALGREPSSAHEVPSEDAPE